MRKKAIAACAVITVITVELLLGADPDDRHLLIGRWEIVSAETNGVADPYYVGSPLVFTDDEFIPFKDDKTWRYEYHIDTSKSPNHFTWWKWVDDEKHITKAIFSVQGGGLTICIPDRGEAPRPTEFKTTKGDQRLLIILTRDQKKEKE